MERNEMEMEKMKKVAAALLIVLGLTGLTLGFFYIRQNLKAATTAPKSAKSAETAESLAELQTTDTDKDGLSDYEELYLYGTSPFLEDTDSDGINDKTEITNGEDPNCPKGQNCLEGNAITSPYGENPQIKTTIPNAESPAIDESSLNNLTPSQLRELLKQAGMGEDVLNSVSDEELQKMYQDTLLEIQKK